MVGLIADSLALLSDAAHMATDAAAIGLALAAIRLAARPATGTYTGVVVAGHQRTAPPGAPARSRPTPGRNRPAWEA